VNVWIEADELRGVVDQIEDLRPLLETESHADQGTTHRPAGVTAKIERVTLHWSS